MGTSAIIFVSDNTLHFGALLLHMYVCMFIASLSFWLWALVPWGQIISGYGPVLFQKSRIPLVDTAAYPKYMSQDAALYNPTKYSILLRQS